MFGGQSRRGDPAQQYFSRHLAQLQDRLPHGGQRRIDVATHLDIVEADHRQLGRYTDIALGSGSQHTDADHVVGGEDGAGRIALQQDRRGVVAAGAGEIAFQHALTRHFDARLFQGPAKSGQTHLRHASSRRAADGGDVPMPQLQQVPGGQVGTVFVIDAHQVCIDAVQSAVDNHHRRADIRQALCQPAIAAR
ncbi:hypothetical protein D3C85_1260180 [compost metagenome]